MNVTEIAVFDTETTGVDVENDRIVTAFFGIMNAAGELTRKQSWVIDPGFPIPDGAAAVHGWTTERVQTEGRKDVEQAINEIADALFDCFWASIPVVIYNAPYDLTLLDREFGRWTNGGSLEGTIPYIIDPLVIDKQIDRYRPGKRQLSVTAAHYGIPVANAHDAEADCIMAGRLALTLLQHRHLKRYSVAQIHERTVGYYAEQMRGLAKHFRSKGKHEAADGVTFEWPIRTRHDVAGAADKGAS